MFPGCCPQAPQRGYLPVLPCPHAMPEENTGHTTRIGLSLRHTSLCNSEPHFPPPFPPPVPGVQLLTRRIAGFPFMPEKEPAGRGRSTQVRNEKELRVVHIVFRVMLQHVAQKGNNER